MRWSTRFMMKGRRIKLSGRDSKTKKSCCLLRFITIQTLWITYLTRSENYLCQFWWFTATMTLFWQDLCVHKRWFTCVTCTKKPNKQIQSWRKWKHDSLPYWTHARKTTLTYKKSLYTFWTVGMRFMCRKKIIESFKNLLMNICMWF